MDRPHKAEVATVELPHHALADQPAQGPEGEDGVEVRPFVGAVVGVGPGEVGGLGGYLAVGAVAKRVVYVEAGLGGQVDPAGGDEREAALREGSLEADEGRHPRPPKR